MTLLNDVMMPYFDEFIHIYGLKYEYIVIPLKNLDAPILGTQFGSFKTLAKTLLSDKYLCARVLAIFKVFASFCIGKFILHQHKGKRAVGL